MHYYHLALEFLAASLSSILVGYPLLWLLFGRDRQGVIKPPLYWHVVGMMLAVALMILLRFSYAALSGDVALFQEGIDDVSVLLMVVLPLVICFLIVKKIRKMAFRRAATRSHAPVGTRQYRERWEHGEHREPYAQPHGASYGEPHFNSGMGVQQAAYQTSPAHFSQTAPPMETHGGPQRAAAQGASVSSGHENDNEAFVGSLEGVDESILLAIDEELETGNIDRATWIKAYAEADGVEHRVKARYIRLRAVKLQSMEKPGSASAQSWNDRSPQNPGFNPDQRH